MKAVSFANDVRVLTLFIPDLNGCHLTTGIAIPTVLLVRVRLIHREEACTVLVRDSFVLACFYLMSMFILYM